ncbi:hypothetical protein AAFP35_08770 [Gordonia sp. CPCC 206044]
MSLARLRARRQFYSQRKLYNNIISLPDRRVRDELLVMAQRAENG